MKTHLTAALSLCLFFQQGLFADSLKQDQIIEKGSKSEASSTINLNLTKQKPSIPGQQGPKGATGLAFTPTYAAAFLEGSKDCGFLAEGAVVTVPFSSIDFGEGISLDSSTSIFTMPKGTYSVCFQVVMDNESYSFDPVYLDIDGTQLILARTISKQPPPYHTLSGSTLFDIPNDNAQVTLRLQIKAAPLSAGSVIFADPLADQNYPTRIVFQKIGE